LSDQIEGVRDDAKTALGSPCNAWPDRNASEVLKYLVDYRRARAEPNGCDVAALLQSAITTRMRQARCGIRGEMPPEAALRRSTGIAAQ
jgi:hypothetical protein